MAWKAHSIVWALRLGCALLLGTTLISSCAAPRYRYISDSGDKTYFKVPYGWKQVDPADLCGQLELMFGLKSCLPTFNVAYQDSGKKPAAQGFLDGGLTRPFLFAEVYPVSSTSGATVTWQSLEDAFLPVSPAARAAAPIPLTHFALLSQAMETGSDGFLGVRESFDYTFPGGLPNTFNVAAFTNSTATQIYLLVVHCLASCYRQDKAAIDAVMNSFTIRRY